MDGTLHRDGDVFVIRIERVLPQPVERVWDVLASTDGFRHWIDDSGDRPLGEGEIVASEPLRSLDVAWNGAGWPSGPIRFDLTLEGESTRLVLAHRHPLAGRDAIQSELAAWDHALWRFEGLVAGEVRRFDLDRLARIRADYERMVRDVFDALNEEAQETGAVFSREPDGGSFRIERTLAHPIERVWASLTEPDRLAEWLGEVEIEPRVGGRLRIVFTVVDPPAVLESVVDEIDPPQTLQFRFADGVGDDNLVRFELTAQGAGTRLALTQFRVPTDEELADNAGGWHVRIDMLEASLDHGVQEMPWSRVEALHARYTALVAGL